ncbi:MAG TPA: DPP IV N-terminal domain-containing protein [Thermoanaerobaculia bacterium]|nr:DPP IV N-terminal domain-containing protein [Thermoanaerobaculia bacterium]
MTGKLRPASRALSVLVLAALPLAALGPKDVAARKPLTLEAISGERSAVPRGATGIAWRDANRVTWLTTEGSGRDAAATLWQYDVATGKKVALLARPTLPPGGKDGKDTAPKPLPLTGYQWNPAGTAVLLSAESHLVLWNFSAAPGAELKRLTSSPDAEEHATFSPDGTRVAFVRKNDLWALDLAGGRETRLTTTGAEHVLNGRLDWVYEEELAHRESGRSYEWSPDSKAIAYLRLDENRVPEYPIVDFAPTNGKLIRQRYPKAGDPNAIPSVHVVELLAGTAAPQDLSFADDDVLVAPEFSWTPDSKAVAFVRLNRVQTTAEVFLLPRAGGAPRLLLSESDPAWINRIEPPRFLRDGSGFLTVSERSGFAHLYRHGMDGAPRNAVTAGPWMIDGPVELDETAGVAYFASTVRDPRERHVGRARLDGTGITTLPEEPGTHSVVLCPGGRFFASLHSTVDAPPKLILRKSDGTAVALLDEPANWLSQFALGTVELSSFRGADGTLFYTSLVKPADFDPTKRYPAVVYVYGGPHEQLVRNAWNPGRLGDHVLAGKGILVWSMDNRGSWGRGHAFETPILKRLGTVELSDQLEGIAELKKRPYVDGSRLGIQGWSYGGFMTLTAATHAGGLFRAAVAGAPVVAWKLYDSIYTERYMKLPKDNPDGYAAASPLEAAGKLGTKLLILHGTSDDNVHMQNTILFADELMKARKDFAFVPLPGQPHGPRDPAARTYRLKRTVEFLAESLLK